MQKVAVLYLDETDQKSWESTLHVVPQLLHLSADASEDIFN